MSTLSYNPAERLDGPAIRSGDDADSRAASGPSGLAEASQVFFAFAGMPLVVAPSALEPRRGG
jgi:hypothetical protein